MREFATLQSRQKESWTAATEFFRVVAGDTLHGAAREDNQKYEKHCHENPRGSAVSTYRPVGRREGDVWEEDGRENEEDFYVTGTGFEVCLNSRLFFFL